MELRNVLDIEPRSCTYRLNWTKVGPTCGLRASMLPVHLSNTEAPRNIVSLRVSVEDTLYVFDYHEWEQTTSSGKKGGSLNFFNAEIMLYNPWRPKRFFNFKSKEQIADYERRVRTRQKDGSERPFRQP